MSLIKLTDRQQIEGYLRHFPQFNYYHLGDLDDFFWPHTEWYGWQFGDEIQALALLYTAPRPQVLLGILNDNREQMDLLLKTIKPSLPGDVYSHLSPGLEALFQPEYGMNHNGEHYKMVLTNADKLGQVSSYHATQLDQSDLPKLEMLYQAAYPGNWFTPRMLDSGQYVGIFSNSGELICVAGVHVYSPQYRVAALGNITTHPDYRGQGYATAATADLCSRLLDQVDLIGLNVRTDNHPGVTVYEKIGFEIVTTYHEWNMKRSSVSTI